MGGRGYSFVQHALFSQFLEFAIPLIIRRPLGPSSPTIGRGAGRCCCHDAAGRRISGRSSPPIHGRGALPSLVSSHVEVETAAEASGWIPSSRCMPPLMNVATALVLAFMRGAGMAHLRRRHATSAAREFRDMVSMTIETVILPRLHFGIFAA